MTYLDHNATTQIAPEILQKMNEIYGLGFLNPSSVHKSGKIAKKHLLEAKNRILKALNCQNPSNYDIIFTSSGTEANNLALSGKNFYRSPFEHESVRNLPNGSDEIAENCEFSSIIWANNITGVVNDVENLKKTKFLHTDAVQFAGKRKIDLSSGKIDAITISGHKIHAPHGIACLVFSKSYPISPIVVGGSQNESLHAGTYNLPAIVALSHAIEMVNCDEYLEKYQNDTQKLRQKLEDCVQSHGGVVIGVEFDRISNTSCIAKIGIPSTEQLMIFDQNDICVSAGSACSAGVVSKSYVLQAMNLPDEIVSSAIRVSVGISNTESEIDEFCRIWKGL